jgi:putative hydrolase of the HAD superfamily
VGHVDLSRFDAVLVDVGGVLVLPDPTVLGPLLAPYGGDPSIAAHRRAHYAAMAVKSRAGVGEVEWTEYDLAYVDAVGVRAAAREFAATALHHTRSPFVWQWPIPESIAALRSLDELGVPIGVVSNASGQVEAMLGFVGVCQRGPGSATPVRCIVDSHVVGVAKPDPRIFDHALSEFPGIARERVVYVGDSITMDVGGARAAGLTAVLFDPYDDHVDEDVERISALTDLLPVPTTRRC